MSTLGSLVVEVAANVARFQSDMGKMAQIAEQRAQQMDRAVGVVSTSLKALGAGVLAGLSMDKIKSSVDGVIQSAAGLQQLAERAGSSAERVGALAAVAKVSGGDVDLLAASLQKVAKSAVDAQNGGQKNAEAFRAIGISVADLRGKRPDELYELIARKQALWADGTEKTAIMQQLLGKAGANNLPVFKDIAEVGDLQVRLTKEQIALADEYEKVNKRLEAAQGAIYKIIAFEVLPVMLAFKKAMLESATQADGLKGAVNGLAKDGGIREWAEVAARSIAFVVDAFDGATRVAQMVVRTISAGANQMDRLLRGDLAGVLAVGEKWKKEIDAIASKPLFSDRLNKQLEEARKNPPKAADDRPRPNFNPNADPAGAARRQLQAYLKAYDEFMADEKKRMEERERYFEFYERLELITTRQSVEEKAAQLRANLAIQEAIFNGEAALVAKRMELEKDPKERVALQEKLAEIARRRGNAEAETDKKITDGKLKLFEVQRLFDLQTQERARLTGLADQQAQFELDMMGRTTLETEKAVAARRVQLELEERIRTLRKQDPLADTSGAIAQAAIQSAQEQARIQEKYEKQRDAIFGANEALRKYAEDATNFGGQLEQAVGGALRGMEDALVRFATTGKLSFHDLASSIIADLARIFIRTQVTGPLAQALFGGNFMANAGGFFSGLGSLLGFAEGGDPPVGRPSWVGERGPELFVPKVAGTVVPNGAVNGGGGTIVINQYNTYGDVASMAQVRREQQRNNAALKAELMRQGAYS